MKIKRITFIFCSIVLSVLSGCIETPDASQFHAPTISASAATSAGGIVTITCQLSKGALPSQITFRLSKSQSMSDAIEKTVIGTTGMSCSATFFGLEEGIQYYFDAEASGGRSSCRSSVGSFKTAEAFDIDKDTKQINYQQQYVEFEVVSSIGLSVQIEDGADWVRESDTKATTKYRKSFLVDYNSSVEERTATIVFKSATGGENRTARIFQAGGPITFEDDNFKKYLVSNFDKDGDGEIVLDEAKEVKEIWTDTEDMVSLQGIEFFTNLQTLRIDTGGLQKLDVSKNTALTSLMCWNNQLTTLDVSKNTALTALNCENNRLTVLDVTKNTALTYLSCGRNQLRELDVTKNTALTDLYCENNRLTVLDVTKNTALTYLSCGRNQLRELDVTKNAALTRLECGDNQLKDIDVSKNTELIELRCANNQLTNLDVSTNTLLNELYCCDNPDLAMVWLAPGQNINYLDYDSSVTKIVHKDDIVNIPDANFKRYLVQNFDEDGDGEISISEAMFVESIDVCTDDIATLEGIEYFTNLRSLSACGTSGEIDGKRIKNGKLISLNVSMNTALTILWCHSNQLSNLDVSKNTALTRLNCSNNQLTSFDVSKNIAVYDLYCSNNQLTNLDVSKNTLLNKLLCSGNQLTNLDVSKNTELTWLDCSDNQLVTIDISRNIALTSLFCYNNQLTTLGVSKNTELRSLECGNNKLLFLEVSDNVALTVLDCSNNQLTSLGVSKNTALTELKCRNNKLTNLDVSKNTELTWLNCSDNQLVTIDISRNIALTSLFCYNNQLINLDVSRNIALIKLWCYGNRLTSLDVSNNITLTELYCYDNHGLATVWLAPGQNIDYMWYDSSVTKIVHKDDKVNIPDANFKKYLVENFDKNRNGEIEYKEAYEISHIGCDGLNIRSLVGIESMTQLVDINCNGNSLSEINLSANTKLTHLSCADNNLTSLDLQYNKSLVYLHCFSNQLTSLDVSNNTSLNVLNCTDNRNMTVLWLANGQTINDLSYDQNITTIRYK